MNILQQYINYMRWINYKLFIEKGYLRIKKDVEELEDRVKHLIKQRQNHLLDFKAIDSTGQISLYLEHKENKRFLDRVLSKLPFFKFDGYIIHINKGNDIKLLKIKDLKYIFNHKNKEMYAIHKKIGYFNNKPVFIVKYPVPITLEIEEEKLFYDCETFNNYVDTATKINLTNIKTGSRSLPELIKNYWFIILISIIIGFLLLTPEGKEFINGIIPQP